MRHWHDDGKSSNNYSDAAGGNADESTDWKFDFNKLNKPLDVLFVKFDVIVPGSLDPQRVNGPRTSLEDHLSMGEVYDVVVGAVNDEDE